MRSTFSGLNTMVRGVFSNQLSLDTVGHNITNASTEGYSRQSVNLAATRGQNVSSLYGDVIVGTGVDSVSIQRARNIYADKQFWSETAQQQYYKTCQTNYDKVEAIFNDSDKTGILNSMEEFYKAWQDLSANASTDSNRVAVIEKGNVFTDKLKTATQQMQSQINAQYDDMSSTLTKINDITNQLTKLNQNIMSTEATGASANDLRDKRDLLVDELSGYMNLNVYEDDNGMYTVVSNGVSMVNGINRLTLEMSTPIANSTYGINDYSIQIKESGIAYIPTDGSLKAQLDTIAEDKSYIDKMADMAGFMLTTFNNMHQQGAGIDGSDSSLGTADGPTFGINFFGDNNTVYTWDSDTHSVVATEMQNGTVKRSLDYTESTANGVTTRRPSVKIDGTVAAKTNLDGVNIINALSINTAIAATGGTSLIAARSFTVTQNTDANGAYLDTYSVTANGPKDGTNAVNMSSLFNLEKSNVKTTADISFNGTAISNDKRAIDNISLNAYYNSMMSQLGSDSESVDDKADAQDDLINQIVSWRSSTSGVDWNEELTNMIMFQQGYSACSRCLTTMDEMLDKLINSTGMVGR
ncbi:MAG: flagellar hook-associated protein FlgK [Selenomonas sp.]|nr:flagellar hook-associated protein FlgK [Selenomonas sp.]